MAAGKKKDARVKSKTAEERNVAQESAPDELRDLLDLSPACHAVFVARRLAFANFPFLSTFLPQGSDRKKFSFRALLGRTHASVEKDLVLLDEGALPATQFPVDLRLKKGDGSDATFSLVASRISWGKQSGVALALTDVSDRLALASSFRDQALAVETLLEEQLTPVMLVRDMKVVKANRPLAEFFGLNAAAELSGKDPAEFMPARMRDEFIRRCSEAAKEKGRKASVEGVFTSPKGERHHMRIMISPAATSSGPAAVCTWEDITPLREVAEEDRRLTKEKTILETLSHDLHQLLDPSSVVAAALKSSMKWLGFESGGAYLKAERGEEFHLGLVEQLPDGVSATLGVQSPREGVTGLVVRTAEPLMLDVGSYPAHLPYAGLFADAGMKHVLYLPLASDEQVHAILLLCTKKNLSSAAQDATLLASISRHAGDAFAGSQHTASIRDAETRFRSMVEGVNGIIYEASGEGVYRYIGPQVTSLTGYHPEECLRIKDFWRSIVHPDDLESFDNRFPPGERYQTEGSVTYRVLPKGKAGYRTVRDFFQYRKDSQGNVVGVTGIMVEPESPRAADEPSGQTSPDDVGVMRSPLAQSEEMLRKVIDTMGDALLICDLEGKVWEANREFTRLTGYVRQDVIGQEFPYPWLVEDEASRFLLWLGALREKGFLRDFDMTWRRPDGGMVAISLNTTFLRNSAGEPIAMLNIGRDISERVKLSNKLSATSRQVETLNRVISKANSTMDLPQIFDLMAEEILALITFDHLAVCLLRPWGDDVVVTATWGNESVVPRPGFDLPLKGSLAAPAITTGKGVVIEDILDFPTLGKDCTAAKAGMRSALSVPIIVKGNILGALTVARGAAYAYTGDELNVLQPIADQIGALVDRTTLFDRVRADSAYIHNLLNSIDSAVFTVDRELKVMAANAAWREFALAQGTPEWADETGIPGHDIMDLIAQPALREEIKEVVPRLLAGAMREFSCEFDVGESPGQRTYQLVITPMTVERVVTGLVFTTTDITNSKRTEAEVKRRNEELVALNAVASSIITSLNLDDILKVAGERIKELTSAGVVLCYLRQSSSDMLALASSIGISETDAARIRIMSPVASVSGSVVASKSPIIIPDGISSDPLVALEGQKLFGDRGMRSLMALPIQTKERVLGTLVIVFPDRHEFVEQEQRFLQLICNQLGSALENAKLYAEVQLQVQRTTLLYEIGQGLTGALDRKTIFSIVHAGLARAMQFESFAFFGVTSEGGIEPLTRLPEQTDGIRPEEQGIIEAALGSTYAGLSTGDASLIAVPVKSKGAVMGVLAVKGEDVDPVAHLRLVESIGTLTGITLDRALLYDDTVAKSVEIEKRNKELDDFTYVVSHDLKEPLITIEGYSKIVLDDYHETVHAEAREYLSSVVNASLRMRNLIDDLLTLSRLGRVSELQEGLPLGDVINSVLHDFEFTLRERHATVVVADQLPVVRYNRTRLSMVFRNLIANAIKFNRSENPRVEISVEDMPEEYVVTVRDNGIGIDNDHFEKIFVIFQRLHRSDEFPGTGAGLTIVKRIIEAHHGRIWVESTLGEGTTFKFTILR